MLEEVGGVVFDLEGVLLCYNCGELLFNFEFIVVGDIDIDWVVWLVVFFVG